MSTVATVPRVVAIVGSHPRETAAALLEDSGLGGDALLLVLGPEPSPRQRLVTADALGLADRRRIVVEAELVADTSRLRAALRDEDLVRIDASRSERRRWKLAP